MPVQENVAAGGCFNRPVAECLDSAVHQVFPSAPKNQLKILDAGAGTGLTGFELHKLGYTNIDALGGGRKGGTNTAIPHMVAREYRNTASKFSQIPKPQLQMGKS